MAEAVLVQNGCMIDWTADADYDAGAVVQLRDGRAGVVSTEVDSGEIVGVYVEGVFTMAKTTSLVLLVGGRAYWDHSENKVNYKPVLDRDFYLGRIFEAATSAATTVKVALNIDPPYCLDINRTPCVSVVSGTGAGAGFGYPVRLGGTNVLELTATSEVQKVDLMTTEGIDLASNPIVEGAFRIISDGSNATQDFTIGLASGTHATDFQSVVSFVAVSTVGNSTNINVQSDDATTDVAPTNSTITYTEGATYASRVEFWMDFTDPADVQVYINGALVLPNSTFTAGTSGTHYLIAHLEKTTGTDVYKVGVDWLRARLAQS